MAVFLDAGEPGDRFRFWTQGEMRPDGVFDTGVLSGRNARWLRITIRSTRNDGMLAVGRVLAE